MDNWQNLGSNIIKLEGYGLYVTCIDEEIYVCEMIPHSGLPTLDPDKCINWDKLEDPPNQKFLNIINARFDKCLVMHDFGKPMSIRDIKSHTEQQRKDKDGKDN